MANSSRTLVSDAPLLDVFESGEKARLLPVAKDSQLEDRATSILLAGMAAVPRFAGALLSGVGPRVGSRSRLSCYTQVVLKARPDTAKLRPDGLIEVANGPRRWRALVEGKIQRAEHEEAQIRDYMQLAKLNRLDALITVSNQFASLPTHHPTSFLRPLPRGVELFHWSWMSVVTTATLLLIEDDFASTEQGLLMSELVRYFSHPASGVQGFDRMNAEWKDVVSKVQTGAALSRDSEEVENTVASWHQETRDLCLILTRALGARVRLKLSRDHEKSAATRLRSDCASLIEGHCLKVEIEVQDAAAPLTIVADLQRRALIYSMRIQAPKDKKKATGRTNWLLRQLKNSTADGILINACWPRRSAKTQVTLEGLKEDPKRIEQGMSGLAPTAFEVVMIRDLSGRFSGRKTFVETLEAMVPEFYRRVGQRLRAWVPPPPRLDPPALASQPPDLPEASDQDSTAEPGTSDQDSVILLGPP